MAEYIDRQEAILAHLDSPMFSGGFILASDTLKRLADVPIAKVAPVVHGRWRLMPISIRSVKKTNIPEAVCSICGGRFCDITNSVTLYRFCPNCGAKMEKEGNYERQNE